MKQETSQWGKAVKKAVIDHDMTLKQLAEKIGYSNATVSQVVNGRYSNSSYKVIAEKINEVLGTEGLPERTETPSDEWCQTVKVELVKQSMTVNELAKQLDVSRDRLSLVINGKMMNEAIVSGVNNLLGEEYLPLLFKDEVKNYLFRCSVNATTFLRRLEAEGICVQNAV